VTRERTTASRHGPWYRQRAVQRCQWSTVSLSTVSAGRGSGAGGSGRCEGAQTSVSVSRCPADRVTSQSTVSAPGTTRTGPSAPSQTASGPATATVQGPRSRTHGTTRPWWNRSRSALRTVTVPESPSTTRTRLGSRVRGGMKSVTRTVPAGVSHRESRTSVPGRYARLVQRPPLVGARRQNPLSSVPSSAARQAGESKRGRQSQSTEPSRPTMAAVSWSPTRA